MPSHVVCCHDTFAVRTGQLRLDSWHATCISATLDQQFGNDLPVANDDVAAVTE